MTRGLRLLAEVSDLCLQADDGLTLGADEPRRGEAGAGRALQRIAFGGGQDWGLRLLRRDLVADRRAEGRSHGRVGDFGRQLLLTNFWLTTNREPCHRC